MPDALGKDLLKFSAPRKTGTSPVPANTVVTAAKLRAVAIRAMVNNFFILVVFK
jgi:hypothetical protein